MKALTKSVENLEKSNGEPMVQNLSIKKRK